jgi:hypothetical protein
MAERRMFAKTIIGSDAFLDMPQSTQALYFHLSMRADDDGFINSPQSIMRLVGCKDDDLKILCSKKFIIPFDSGIVVIKHWRIHNYIAKDRYTETKYKKEKASLAIDENGSYTGCIQIVDECDTQVRIGKGSVGKDRKIREETDASASSKNHFHKPTIEEVKEYCIERGNGVDANKWMAHYDSVGWKVGKNAMKDWKAAVRTWEPNGFEVKPKKKTCKKCGHELASAGDYIGTCWHDGCELYHLPIV